MRDFMAASVQMVSGKNYRGNLEQADKLVYQASCEGAGFVVLPECFSAFDTGALLPDSQIEETREHCSLMAKKYNLYLIAGTIPVNDSPDNSRPYAACFMYDRNGQEMARYNKIHLFDANVDDGYKGYRESALYFPGSKPVCIETPLGKIGFAVCYDLRFPELFRLLFERNVDVIVIPSAFTNVTGAAHWMPLLQARAIENQCYIVAANQGGCHSKKRMTYGHSAIISPWGDIMDSMERGTGIVTAMLDHKKLSSIRNRMPTKQHQRFSVCSTIEPQEI